MGSLTWEEPKGGVLRIHQLVDEPVFPEAWEGRAFALALLSTRVAGWNLDAFRHALERLSRTDYLDDGYFGRWLNAAELVLTDSAVLAPKAVEARARNLRGKHVVEPPGAQALTAGEMRFAATHRYGEATAKRRHSPGTPLSS